MEQYWAYMMTNRNKTVVYTGVTNDLKRRVQEHKYKKGSSFRKRYNINMLIYYESFSNIYSVITPMSILNYEKDIGIITIAA